MFLHGYLLACEISTVRTQTLMASVFGSLVVGREFACRPGHTKDHHKYGTGV